MIKCGSKSKIKTDFWFGHGKWTSHPKLKSEKNRGSQKPANSLKGPYLQKLQDRGA